LLSFKDIKNRRPPKDAPSAAAYFLNQTRNYRINIRRLDGGNLLPQTRTELARSGFSLNRYNRNSLKTEPLLTLAQALPHPKAGGDHSVSQPKAGGDHNVSQHQKTTFEVAKRFMEQILFTKTPWPIISNEKYSMVDEACLLAIEAQDRQQALAVAPVDTPSACELPSGLSLKIDPQTGEAISVFSAFCSSIGLVMILFPKIFIVKTQD
jgi:hypothetical protein